MILKQKKIIKLFFINYGHELYILFFSVLLLMSAMLVILVKEPIHSLIVLHNSFICSAEYNRALFSKIYVFIYK